MDSRTDASVSPTARARYQGENNMHGFFGNSAAKSGYACLAIKLVSDWRAIWSKNSGTSAAAPFGVVTLPPSGSEGGADIGSMRYAQTGAFSRFSRACMTVYFDELKRLVFAIVSDCTAGPWTEFLLGRNR